jgi:hypothetical protein
VVRYACLLLLLLVMSACALLLPLDGLGSGAAPGGPDAREADAVTDATHEVQRDAQTLDAGDVHVPDGASVWRPEVGGNGHAYLLVTTGLITWTAAQEEAVLAGGHLVTTTSAAEHAFVRTLLADAGTLVWLGARQQPSGGANEPDKNWGWVTDEPWSYTHWRVDQPNDTSGAENYAVYYEGDFWHDIEESGGSAVDAYVVEFE